MIKINIKKVKAIAYNLRKNAYLFVLFAWIIVSLRLITLQSNVTFFSCANFLSLFL